MFYIDSIDKASCELIEVAREYQVPLLEKYGNKLYKHVYNLDIDAIEKTLSDFSEVMEPLQKKAKRS